MNLPAIPKELRKGLYQWKTKKTKDNSNWGAVPIRGTTFSGHPTKTTLGNTLRSLCYSYFYLEQAGLARPWDNPNCSVVASGDDVVIWVDPAYQDRLTNAITELTASTKDAGVVGLGQVVKEILVGNAFDISF